MEFTERETLYKRKRDGAIVSVADWPDKTVSWMVKSIPVISLHQPIVGTCSLGSFEKSHIPQSL